MKDKVYCDVWGISNNTNGFCNYGFRKTPQNTDSKGVEDETC